MFVETVLGAVILPAASAGVAGGPHEVPALDVVLHPVLALDHLGADEAAPAVFALLILRGGHVLAHLYRYRVHQVVFRF